MSQKSIKWYLTTKFACQCQIRSSAEQQLFPPNSIMRVYIRPVGKDNLALNLKGLKNNENHTICLYRPNDDLDNWMVCDPTFIITENGFFPTKFLVPYKEYISQFVKLYEGDAMYVRIWWEAYGLNSWLEKSGSIKVDI